MGDEKNDLSRREFSSAALMALLSGVTVTVMGCSSSNPGNPMTPGDPSDPGGGGTAATGEVSENHGHGAIITNAQVAAGVGVTLDIREGADHPHTVALSMQELAQVVAGQALSKVSTVNQSPTTGPHSHTVSFNA